MNIDQLYKLALNYKTANAAKTFINPGIIHFFNTNFLKTFISSQHK